MSNYKDLSSEELKRTLAEKQDILRRTMKPDEYKKFMQELDDCQIKIDYSKFGKPVQYTNCGVTANYLITKTVEVGLGDFSFEVKSETDNEIFALLTSLN